MQALLAVTNSSLEVLFQVRTGLSQSLCLVDKQDLRFFDLAGLSLAQTMSAKHTAFLNVSTAGFDLPRPGVPVSISEASSADEFVGMGIGFLLHLDLLNSMNSDMAGQWFPSLSWRQRDAHCLSPTSKVCHAHWCDYYLQQATGRWGPSVFPCHSMYLLAATGSIQKPQITAFILKSMQAGLGSIPLLVTGTYIQELLPPFSRNKVGMRR